MLDSLANQSPREATGHAIAHIGTSDYSETKYDKQFVTVSLACTRQAPGEGLTRSNNSLHFHFLLTSGSTQAIEDKERLYIMCSSYSFVYLLEPILSTNTPRHKQLFSDVVHRSQRGLAIRLRRVMPSLPRTQRQLLHTTQKRQQRPARDNVKSGGDADVLKLESASRRTQDSHKDCHKVNHRDGHYQSRQSHGPVDTNRTQSSIATATIH